MKKLISIISAICMVVTIIPFSAYAASITPQISIEKFSEQLVEMQEEYEDEPLSNRLIVKSERKINKLDSVAIAEGYNGLHIVQFDNSESAEKALKYYEEQNSIEYAEADMTMTTCETTEITYDNHLSWGSESMGVDDYIDYLGDVSTLPEVVVGIIDTGIDLDHEFLQDRIIPTGINYSSTGNKNSEDDDKGHGTHVAGIIVDNTTENVKIRGYKCLNAYGSGNLSDVILAVYSAIEDRVNVINMSLGGNKNSNTKNENSSLEDAVMEAINSGITVCVAAGNSGANSINYTPASIEDCITVGAIDAYDDEPFWSNWGDVVDIVAPGVSIYSSYNDGGYTTLSGTSMATPFVSAASAMILCKNINYSPSEINDILIQNGREWTTSEEYYLYGKPALYLGNINNFSSKERTSTPVFSIEGGKYSDGIYVEIHSDDDAEIYYTLDGNRATNLTGTLYTEPVFIDKVTTLHAVAYAPNKLKSLQAFADYYITYTDDESNFKIDSNGVITAYNGKSKYLTIPDTINGITVTGIGEKVFYRNHRDIVMIKFPNTLTTVYESAFEICDKLEYVISNNLKNVGKYAFYGCDKLIDIDLTNLENADDYAFAYCLSMHSLYNDKLTEISDYAFTDWENAISIDLPNVKKIGVEGLSCALTLEHLNIVNVEHLDYRALSATGIFEELYLPNLVSLSPRGFQFSYMLVEKIIIPKYNGKIPNSAFTNCDNLIVLYIPLTESIADNVFSECKLLKNLFLPNLTTTESLPPTNNINIYLSDKFTSCSTNSSYHYNIIAPSGSYAEQWAKEKGHTFIPSDCRALDKENKDVAEGINIHAKGKSICTSVAGLRFGFDWTTIPEIEDLAANIEYGLIYSQKGVEDLSVDTVDGVNVKSVIANNRITNGEITSFNLVISNIPRLHYNSDITARAYVCIDGMYFYSNIQKGSFGGVAGLVLKDDYIDEITKNAVKKLIAQEV